MDLEDYEIECHIGGYGVDNFWLRSDGKRLLYFHSEQPIARWEKAEIIESDQKVLARFIESIKRLGKWKRKYEGDILDGQQWEFLIKGPDIYFKAYGSNNYPGNFDDAIAAIVDLVDGRSFG